MALASGALAVALLYAALFFGSARIDAISATREAQLVENGLASQIREIEDGITAITQWDEAVEKTNPPMDRDWVGANIGAFLDQSLGVEATVLLNAAGGAVYASRGGGESDSLTLARLMDAAAPLVATVRGMEAERGDFPTPDGGTIISSPIRASAAHLLEGAPYIVTATLIQPDFGLALPAGPRGDVLVTADNFDAAFETLSAHYLLRDAALHAGAEPHAPGRARAFLRAPDGAPVATIAWTPQRPGRQLLKSALPIVSFTVLTLATGGVLTLLALRDSLRSLRRTMRELVRARDDARAADRAKSQFLAFMSHEIRTPLNGVLGMAQILLMSERDPRRREQIDIIRTSGESLLTMLSEVLDLSKIEAGRMDLHVAPFDLGQMATAACAAFSGVAESKGVAFDLRIADSARGTWQGDAGRLRQILQNLVSNAVKFTEAGRVEVGVRVHGPADAPRLEMMVTDTGLGIPAATVPLLFQKFVQGDASHSRRFGGTGLGLAIAQELAALMGGAIFVRSREGEGSSFWLDAPIRPAVAGDARAAAAA